MRKNLNNIEEVKEKDKENEDRKNFYPHFSYYFRLYTKSGAWKNSSPGFQFLYAKRQISNIIKV